jgi:hypothetical protein
MDKSAGQMSYVANRRRNLDKIIDNCANPPNTASNDIATMMMMMDERAAKRQAEMDERAAVRQADRDERERQFMLEQARRDDEREERRAEREARNFQMQMMMMSKLFGRGSSGEPPSQD